MFDQWNGSVKLKPQHNPLKMSRPTYFHFILLILFILSCAEKKPASKVTLASGTLDHYDSMKSQFVQPRNVDVWLPDGYSPNENYQVLYMHDGQMLFDSTTTWNKQEWGVDETIGRMIAEGKIPPTIVVAIWNTDLRYIEYFPQKPFESLPKDFVDSILQYDAENNRPMIFKQPISSDNYLKFIVQELKPFIDSQYATYTDRKNTFIAGSSMGGLISMYAICEYPEVFGGAACISTHWPGIFKLDNNPIPQAFADYLRANLPNAENHKLYFDYGTETLDALYEIPQQKIDTIIMKSEYNSTNWMTRKFVGKNHSENAWKERLEIPIRFLMGE